MASVRLSIDDTPGSQAALLDIVFVLPESTTAVPLMLDLTGLDLSGQSASLAQLGLDIVGVVSNAPQDTPLRVTHGGELRLDLGVDLTSSQQTPIIRDTSTLGFDLTVEHPDAAGPLTFHDLFGVLAVEIMDGEVGTNAHYDVTLAPGTAGKHELSQAITATQSNVQGDSALAFDVKLPQRVGGATERLTLNIADLSNTSTTRLAGPNVRNAQAPLSLEDDVDIFRMGWGDLLGSLDGALDAAVFSQPLPLVGGGLATAADFLDQMQVEVAETIDELFQSSHILTPENVQTVLFEALGPGGLDWLAGSGSPDDVQLTVTMDRVDFEMRLSMTLRRDVDFDLAIPDLGLELDHEPRPQIGQLNHRGQAEVEIDIQLPLHFGISLADGVFLTANSLNDMELTVSAEFKETQNTGVMGGLLPFRVVDQPVGPNLGQGSFLSGEFSFDVAEPILTRSRLMGAAESADLLDPTFSGESIVQLILVTQLEDATVSADIEGESLLVQNGALPAYQMDLRIEWSFAPTDPGIGSSDPSIQFSNLQFGLDSFMLDFVLPQLQKMVQTFAPLDFWLQETLLARVPVLSHLFGPVFEKANYLQLGSLLGGEGTDDTGDFLGALTELRELYEQLTHLHENRSFHEANWIDLGGFTLTRNSDGVLLPTGDSLRPFMPEDLDFEFSNPLGLKSRGDFRQEYTAALAEHPDTILGQIAALAHDKEGILRDFAAEAFIKSQTLPGTTNDDFNSFCAQTLSGIVCSFVAATQPGIQPMHFGLLENPLVSVGVLLGHDTSMEHNEFQSLMDYRMPDLFHRMTISIPTNILDLLRAARSRYDLITSIAEQVTGQPAGGVRGRAAKTAGKQFIKDALTPALGWSVNLLHFETRADYGFVYDTKGLEDFRVSRESNDIFNGFYVDDLDGVAPKPAAFDAVFDKVLTNLGDDPDTSHLMQVGFRNNSHIDQKQLTVSVGIGLQAQFGAGFLFEIGGEISVFGNGSSNLFDPDSDGKVRANELDMAYAIAPNNIYVGGGGGEARFDVFLSVLLLIDARINVVTFRFLDLEFENDHQANIRLGVRENPTSPAGSGPIVVAADDPPPVDSERIGSTLYLNMGVREDRLDEVFTVRAGALADEVIIASGGFSETHQDVTRIVAFAGAGNDTIRVAPEVTIPVLLDGGEGDDHLIAGGGPATLIGGDGNDVLVGGLADDTLIGGRGNDVLRGGAGSDRLEGDQADGLPEEGGRDELYGEAGNDVLLGGAGADVADGGDGSDAIDGGDGDDRILGGAGSDTIRGGRGNDSLEGGFEPDWISVGEGADRLSGGTGADTLDGGAGPDSIHGALGNDEIDGGPGNDFINAGSSIDVVHGGDGQDTILGGPGGDTLDGGGGDDLIYASSSEVPEEPDVEHWIFAGGGNDTIFAGLGIDRVWGGAGNDYIETFAGDDQIDAGSDDDTILAGAGNDTIQGGWGSDLIQAATELEGADPTARHLIYGDTVDAEYPAGTDPEEHADRIYADLGHDTVYGGRGGDLVFAYDGHDDLHGGDEDDVIHAGLGDDYVEGGIGDDRLFGEQGSDVIWGDTLVLSADNFDGYGRRGRVPSAVLLRTNFSTIPGFDEALPDPVGFATPRITPAAALGSSFVGGFSDGRDLIRGGAGMDWLFGGGAADDLDGEGADDYVDGGAGNDVVQGGIGNDIVRGGANDDLIHGGPGLDQAYGDDGRDHVSGDAGSGADSTRGQRLFGGDGIDFLYGYSSVDLSAADNLIVAETQRLGEEMYGGPGGDFLYGGLRREIMLGDGGNDFLAGDWLAGPLYALSPRPHMVGGDDELIGGSGEDQLLGGGGMDLLWGGADSDWLEGQDSFDVTRGGAGIDILVLDVRPEYFLDGSGPRPGYRLDGGFVVPDISDQLPDFEDFDGHYGNATLLDVNDDNATDILLVEGTQFDDSIRLQRSLESPERMVVDYRFTPLDGNPQLPIQLKIEARWQDGSELLVEQFRATGLGGDDLIEFAAGAEALDVSALNARSNDFVAAFDGGPGNDTLVGSNGRDRLDGGRGSDHLAGLAGNDRLWGDGGEGLGAVQDHDVLFAGQGHDDLIGGQGTNELYAWTFDPRIGQFGVFVDADTGELFNDSGDFEGAFDEQGNPAADGLLDADTSQQARQHEDTGLNRILGSAEMDSLHGGTGLDFLYGNGGGDTLYRSDGSTFESLDGGLTAGDDWKEYAQETDRVWYVGATNADDVISVDFVTEPGPLADHHLVTRLTNNDGNFSFAAQLRLDFNARDDNDQFVWDPTDAVLDLTRLRTENVAGRSRTLADSEALFRSTSLADGLLPPEGDYLAIIIDALGGNDRITVGPTVQRTVWVDAGAGDDVVEILSGNAILVDQTEFSKRNDTAEQAAVLTGDDGKRLVANTTFQGLTIDSPQDVDWYSFQLDADPPGDGEIVITSCAPTDGLAMAIFERQGGTLLPVSTNQDAADLAGNDSLGTAFDFTTAGPLGPLEEVSRIDGLTIHSLEDVDYFRFTLDAGARGGDSVGLLQSDESHGDNFVLQLLDASGTVLQERAVAASQSLGVVVPFLDKSDQLLVAGTYFLRVGQRRFANR